MPQHIKDIQDGLQYATTTCRSRASTPAGADVLKRGWRAQPVRRHDHEKEVVRLVLARDANGGPPGQGVHPILRHTDQMGPDGQPLYYDAAMTRDGTTAENDEIAPISPASAALTSWATWARWPSLAKRPEIAARLSRARKKAAPRRASI